MQVNFSEDRNKKAHFQRMFVFSSAHSCCVRDAFQALKCVRQFGSPELYYCLDTLSNPKQRRLLCTSLEAAGRHVKQMAWLQEHYCGEQVLSTEEDILEHVLVFDPEDNAAAAQKLRALKERLCMARQQGMPACESSGPKPGSPQNTLAQGNPGYALLASLEPNVAAELEKQLHKGQDGYYLGQPVNMLLEKFHFDRRVNCSDAAMEDRALVFDEMCASSFKKERFLRMYHEVNNSGASQATST